MTADAATVAAADATVAAADAAGMAAEEAWNEDSPDVHVADVVDVAEVSLDAAGSVAVVAFLLLAS